MNNYDDDDKNYDNYDDDKDNDNDHGTRYEKKLMKDLPKRPPADIEFENL